MCDKKDCCNKLFYGMCNSCGDGKLNYETIINEDDTNLPEGENDEN